MRAYHHRPAGFPPQLPFVWDEQTLRSGTVFTLDTDLGRIDLLAEVAGLGGWAEVGTNCVRISAFDREVWTLDLPSLIRAKRAAGRPKDLLVLPELESLLDAANDSGPTADDRPAKPAPAPAKTRPRSPNSLPHRNFLVTRGGTRSSRWTTSPRGLFSLFQPQHPWRGSQDRPVGL